MSTMLPSNDEKCRRNITKENRNCNLGKLDWNNKYNILWHWQFFFHTLRTNESIWGEQTGGQTRGQIPSPSPFPLRPAAASWACRRPRCRRRSRGGRGRGRPWGSPSRRQSWGAWISSPVGGGAHTHMYWLQVSSIEDCQHYGRTVTHCAS